jgi:hypothetical protein
MHFSGRESITVARPTIIQPRRADTSNYGAGGTWVVFAGRDRPLRRRFVRFYASFTNAVRPYDTLI